MDRATRTNVSTFGRNSSGTDGGKSESNKRTDDGRFATGSGAQKCKREDKIDEMLKKRLQHLEERVAEAQLKPLRRALTPTIRVNVKGSRVMHMNLSVGDDDQDHNSDDSISFHNPGLREILRQVDERLAMLDKRVQVAVASVCSSLLP